MSKGALWQEGLAQHASLAPDGMSIMQQPLPPSIPQPARSLNAAALPAGETPLSGRNDLSSSGQLISDRPAPAPAVAEPPAIGTRFMDLLQGSLDQQPLPPVMQPPLLPDLNQNPQ